MDFDWSEDQLAYREAVIGFAQRDLADDVVARDAAGEFWLDAWKRCADFGIQSLPIPEDYGGAGADPLTLIVAMEALGYGCADRGLVFSLNAQMWACQDPLIGFGSEEQKRRWLPALGDGSVIAAHGMSEPESGSDAFAMRTSAVRDGEDYVLNGSKTFVTNAPVADLFLVFAVTDPKGGFLGLSAFLVERDAAGLTVGQPLDKMGLRTSPMSEIFLDDCRVPAANLLGRPGNGMAVFTAGMERERSLILASAVGAMDRGLERSVEHARTRQQFGGPIAKFQAVSHRLVDMRLRLDTARMLLYRLGWLMERGAPCALESALVKLHLSESYVANSIDALQVFGGYGYMAEYELERDVRDALGSRIYSGTSDIQRNIAARQMGL